jgi:hypothetical protein
MGDAAMIFSLSSRRSPPLLAAAVASDTVPAAWPSGIARLGVSVTNCEHCPTALACDEWMARTPDHGDTPPPFCPNAGDLLIAKIDRR